MAYLSSLLMIPVEEVMKHHTRESISACVTRSFACSHLIAAHPRIKPILDGGTPMNTELWHPIAKPHYHFPEDLPAAIVALDDLVATEPTLHEEEWTLAEIHKLRDACRYAADHGLAMVVILSNTLSLPTMRGGTPENHTKQPRQDQAVHSSKRPPATIRQCFIFGALVFLSGLGLRAWMIPYGKRLLQKVEAAFMTGNGGDYISIDETFIQIDLCIIASYVLMLAGTGIILLGIVRNRQAGRAKFTAT
ncbi:hypothetical protein OKA04_05955 [Luteolibacter flavescens]|uniref:Uncharacterized protein n=1 Tax=Luteolibacter flavescens TaxID=1859460 RepID=A0ABT3FL21_9BACT|nr:hypothetical protein [Luteolibacter flavescens]MCW1884267.1 hypothetical protein [Luteolibacter flavescens]